MDDRKKKETLTMLLICVKYKTLNSCPIVFARDKASAEAPRPGMCDALQEGYREELGQ